MNRHLLAVVSLCVTLPVAAQEVPDQDGRYLVQFKDLRGAAAAVRAAGGAPVLELAPQAAVAAYLPSQALAGLRRNPNVVIIEPDPRRYPMAQTTPYGITMVQADQLSDANAGKATVCIIDSGYYRAHEDLAKGTNVTGSSGVGTGNWYEDTCGHGTHVAGTIAALNNTFGVKGVLGNGAISLRAEKVFDGAACGWSYSSTLVAALNACRNNTPLTQRLVVNMSLGGSLSSSIESNAFQAAYDAGVLSVAAAGNAGNKRKSYPASYPSVVSVAAVDSSKTVASFSQQNNQVELAAPGVGVLSTVPFASSSVSVGDSTYRGENINGSARANTTAVLVDGGLCSSSTGSWSGTIVLCQRGVDTFATKVANVKAAGGVAAVIYNNGSGGFAGTLNGTSTIAAISISQEDGQALLASKLNQLTTVTNEGGVGSGYAHYDGTSMATPHVSGVAALVWSNAPNKINAQVRAALQATALDLGAVGKDDAYGYGLIQAKAALDYLGGGGSTPGNIPPAASFLESCSGLTCNFTDTSTDLDGTVSSWTWNFGDTYTSRLQNPSHTYAASATYTITLTVTDDDATVNTSVRTVTVAASPGGLSLAATGFKVKGVHSVKLAWSGASGSSVDVYRDGLKVVTTENDGAHTDSTGSKGSASYAYKVCEAQTAVCSGDAQVHF